ncbi:hypothetical protein SAMN04487911_1013 [Arenibacter nanhaiticus]|uniref:Uncharacterized protein n=1 Tax=Arenibacter nanhaiticus TaxID=558155 RepID=A0A1M5ZZR0_9FLAO|nr:hypothetical protein SAMN04487911_1013 [Arenibacter nanhaiticus]
MFNSEENLLSIVLNASSGWRKNSGPISNFKLGKYFVFSSYCYK